MKVGITGASGHIGNNLCRMMLADGGYGVRALIYSGKGRALDGVELELVKGSVLDYESLLRFMEGVDVVVHLAGKISLNGDPDGSVRRINYGGSLNVFRACVEQGVSRLVHFSSIHAMNPFPLDTPLDERRELVGEGHKASAYDRSKADAERKLAEFVLGQGLDAVVLAPTSIMGPNDFVPSAQGKFLLDLYRGKMPALVKGGYDWVDVRDVARATISAIHHGRKGEKYIISGEYKTIREMACLVAEHSPRKAPSVVLPTWVASLGVPFVKVKSGITGTPPIVTRESLAVIRHSCKVMSSQKARAEWDYRARPVRESVGDTIRWFEAAHHTL